MKRISVLFMVFLLTLSTMGYADSNLPIMVNGNTIGYGLVINGTTHLPVRELQSIGAEVS